MKHFTLPALLVSALSGLIVSPTLLAQDERQSVPTASTLAAQTLESGDNTPPRVIIIENTPEIENSQVIRQVVERLEKNSLARRSNYDPTGKPVDLHAIIALPPDFPAEKIDPVLTKLQELSIPRIRIDAATDGKQRVIVNCPFDVAFRTVQSLQSELRKLQGFAFDVRVAANNDPVTPTWPTPPIVTGLKPLGRVATQPNPRADAVEALFPAEAPSSQDSDPTSPPGDNHPERKVCVFHLQYVKASEAARILRQLYGNTIHPAVDERLNSLLIAQDNPRALEEVEAVLVQLDSPATKNIDSSLSLSPSDSLDNLRRQCGKLEQQTLELAAALRNSATAPAAAGQLNDRLREAVRNAFNAQQKLQWAELEQFTQRLQDIRQAIETRQRIAQSIVDRRVEELLDPNLKWDNSATAGKNSRVESVSSTQQTSDRTIELQEVPPETVVWNLIGASFRTASDDDLAGTEAKRGLQIAHLLPNGPAVDAGLQVGDIVVAIDRQWIASERDIDRAWQDTTPWGAPVTVTFIRDGETSWARLKWSRSILQEHLAEGKVLSRRDNEIEVSLGVKDGLGPGDRLTVWSDRFIPNVAEIAVVQQDRSVARIVSEDQAFAVRDGDRVTYGNVPLPTPPADGPSQPNGAKRRQSSVQIEFDTRQLGKIEWLAGPGSLMVDGFGKGRIVSSIGSTTSLRLTELPGRENATLFVTLQIPQDAASNLSRYGVLNPKDLLAHNAIPLEFTAEDFDQALSGNTVTKVIYIPRDLSTTTGKSLFETVVSSGLEPGVDPLKKAADAGTTVVAVTRLSTRLEDAGADAVGAKADR